MCSCYIGAGGRDFEEAVRLGDYPDTFETRLMGACTHVAALALFCVAAKNFACDWQVRQASADEGMGDGVVDDWTAPLPKPSAPRRPNVTSKPLGDAYPRAVHAPKKLWESIAPKAEAVSRKYLVPDEVEAFRARLSYMAAGKPTSLLAMGMHSYFTWGARAPPVAPVGDDFAVEGAAQAQSRAAQAQRRAAKRRGRAGDEGASPSESEAESESDDDAESFDSDELPDDSDDDLPAEAPAPLAEDNLCVQCDVTNGGCGKWRRVPPGYPQRQILDEGFSWVCDMSPALTGGLGCRMPEEDFPDEEDFDESAAV